MMVEHWSQLAKTLAIKSQEKHSLQGSQRPWRHVPAELRHVESEEEVN